MDIVKKHGASRGMDLKPKTVFVEGTSDVRYFTLASRKYFQFTHKDLLADLAIVAAGVGDKGGTQGVLNQLIVFRQLAEQLVDSRGDPIYRMIGLLDNDKAGQQAIKGARNFSLFEYRDLFRLRPFMPSSGGRDPRALEKSFEAGNQVFRGLNWEVEDLVGSALIHMFLEEHPTSLKSQEVIGDMVHREFGWDGKHALLKFCEEHADLDSLQNIVGILHSLRHYVGLPSMR